jgi:hypothetical protein
MSIEWNHDWKLVWRKWIWFGPDNPIQKLAASAADALPWDPLNSLANSSSLLAHEKGKTNVGAI